MRPPLSTLLRARDELPTPRGQETMIAARDQLRAIAERNSVRGLDRAPVVQHSGAYVSSVVTSDDGSIDDITRSNITQLFAVTVASQNQGVTGEAIGARMHATPI